MIYQDFTSLDFVVITSLLSAVVVWIIYRKSRENLQKKQKRYFLLGLIMLGVFFFIVASFTIPSFFVTGSVCFILVYFIFTDKRVTIDQGTLPFEFEIDGEVIHEIADKYDKNMKIGRFFLQDGKYGKARDCFINALKLKPEATDPWLYIGKLNVKLHRYEQAIISFKRVLDFDANHIEAQKELKAVKYLQNSKST